MPWRKQEILTRSSLFSVILVTGVGIVAVQGYRLWSGGPWDLPNPGKGSPIYAVETPSEENNRAQAVSTETIVSRNIFDPQRGEGSSTEVADSSRGYQRISSMVLLGTAIFGTNRVAILQDSPAMRGSPATAGQPAELMRVKLGDTVEGFRLSEIADKRVVFTKGASRIEVNLDYFRKVETVEAKPRPPVRGQVGAPRPVVPRVVPNLPRRQRRPAAPNPSPES
ncbi:MAG: hypothetical protein ACREQ7_01645 [Candidatus Binatia bacterium]